MGNVVRRVVEITPAMATTWLDTRTANRNISTIVVEKYRRAMSVGDWRHDTEEYIKIDANGILLDGQHRLSAIIAFGKPVTMQIATGLPPETFAAIDQGKPRSAKDLLTIKGVPNAIRAAALGRLAYLYLKGQLQNCTRFVPSATEVFDVVCANPSIQDSIRCMEHCKMEQITAASIPGFIHWAVSRKPANRTTVDRYMEKLGIGAELARNEPVFLLRQRLLTLRSGRETLSSYDLLKLHIKAWNATFEKRTLTTLRAFSETDGGTVTFPELLV